MPAQNKLTKARLIPNWPIGKVLKYHVDKSIVDHSGGNPITMFARTYEIELKLLDDYEIEAYYPNGLLNSIPTFDKLKHYLPLLENKGANCLYYKVNTVFSDPRLQNEKAITTYLQGVEKGLMAVVDPKEKQVVAKLFAALYQEGGISSAFLKDIRDIHCYFGIVLLDGEYVDLKQFQEAPDIQPDKMLDALNLQLGSIDLMQFDILENDSFKVETINGHDAIASPHRNDFEALEEQFLYDDFDVAQYENIVLSHFVYTYDMEQKRLQQMSFKSKEHTNTSNLNSTTQITLQ